MGCFRVSVSRLGEFSGRLTFTVVFRLRAAWRGRVTCLLPIRVTWNATESAEWCAARFFSEIYLSKCAASAFSQSALSSPPGKGNNSRATLPKFNSSPLKNDGWKTILSYWVSVTFQGRTLKLREGITPQKTRQAGSTRISSSQGNGHQLSSNINIIIIIINNNNNNNLFNLPTSVYLPKKKQRHPLGFPDFFRSQAVHRPRSIRPFQRQWPRNATHQLWQDGPKNQYGIILNHLSVSENSGTPKSSILIGCSIINHPFWGYPYFWKYPSFKRKWIIFQPSTFRGLCYFWGEATIRLNKYSLVGGWTNPFEKYAHQFGSFPQGSGWR